MSTIATMPVDIYKFNGVDTLTTTLFQLLQWKHAMLLEEKGLMNSRGSVTSHVRKQLQAPRSVQRPALIEYISVCKADIEGQLGIVA